MASIKLNIAIAALVAEAQLSTVEKLFAFLGEKIEIDDDMKGYFEEFKATLKSDQEVDAKAAKSKKGAKGKKAEDGEEKKPKRAPSAYNLYIRDKMAAFKAAGHSGNLMKMAIEAWNEEKAATKESSSDAEEPPKGPAVAEDLSSDAEVPKAKAKRGPKAASQKKETSSDTEETKVKAKKEPKAKTKTKKESPKEEEASTEESDKDYE